MKLLDVGPLRSEAQIVVRFVAYADKNVEYYGKTELWYIKRIMRISWNT